MSRYRSCALALFVFILLIGSRWTQGSSLTTAVIVAVVPDAPSGLAAHASSQSQVDLSWMDNSNNEAGFSIERSVGSDANFSAIATTAVNVAVYLDSGLSPNTLYFYRVAAFNADGSSSYSNEASSATPSAPLPPPPVLPSGGGGGGGGGGSTAPSVFQTAAIFKGIAYPSTNVTLLQNAQVVAVVQAGPDARFEIDVSSMAPGTYNFGVWGEDPNGNRSVTQTFQITVTNGATTVIGGIFLAPTIGADKVQVKRGDTLTMLGYTAPQATVTVIVRSAGNVVKNVTSSNTGAWIYQFPTDILDYGDHTASARAAVGGNITTDSNFIAFTVGSQNVITPKIQAKTSADDLNGDGKVNLIDFSIMAYWYKQPNPPPAADVNHDSKVDLVDFSILAHYWTG